jgi:hypothetical protein
LNNLIEAYELEETVSFKESMNCDDVLAILHHHWCLCADWYPDERQRVQHAMMILFCASTTARAGSIVESSGYYGQNDCIKYGDIRIYAVRDPDNPGHVMLLMLVMIRLLKGRRNMGNP